jgi:Saccharopine dehydrogenase NADP binding domain
LVVGGYGFFGRRLVERLSKHADLHIIVAGRSREAGESLVTTLYPSSASELNSATVDAMSPAFVSALRRLSPTVVVNASGPFQGQDYRVAEACIATGTHYIDLADGREFVTGVGGLNSAAVTAGVLVASGASSVPALSSAAADHLVRGLRTVHLIEIGISPGNRTERGLSTVRGILSYCGKALPTSSPQATTGWLSSYRHAYSNPVGSRLLSPCDVPDLVLLPSRYPGRPEVKFGAGLELETLHRGMNLMAWMARHRLVKDWSEHARWLKRAADLFQTWGTDAGAMHVSVKGLADDGRPIRRSWQLLATRGDGPYVPTLAASALIRKISNQSLRKLGAMPCLGLLSLDDFTVEMQGLNIVTSESPE